MFDSMIFEELEVGLHEELKQARLAHVVHRAAATGLVVPERPKLDP